MKKLLKWILGLVVVFAILLVALIVALPLVFDPNEHKQQIADTVEQSIGRKVHLNGDIKWSVFPAIALTFNDVKIANEKGFKGDYLAEMGQLSAQVQLLPLLKKEVKIGTIALKQPTITLQVAAGGKNNWQSMIPAADNSQAADTGSGSAMNLQIRGIEISNGTLHYQDIPAAMNVAMKELNFSTDQVSAVTASKINFSSHLSIPEVGLDADLATTIQSSALLAQQAPKFSFEKLSLDGSYNDIPLQISSSGNAELDLSADHLNFARLIIELAKQELETSVVGKNISSNMHLSGQLQSKGFQLDDFLAAFGSPLNNQADNKIDLNMPWSMTGNSFKISGLEMFLDGKKITGDFNLTELDKLKGNFKLNIPELNIDQYLPAEDSSANNAATASTDSDSKMDFGHLNGTVNMTALTLGGVNISELLLKLKTNGDELEIIPLKGDFYQGLINTSLSLNKQGLTIKPQVSNVQAGQLLNDLMGSEYMTGLGSFNANLQIDQPFTEKPLKTAHGTINYQLKDGDIAGIDVFDIVQNSLSLLNKQQVKPQKDELKTEFGLMEFAADVEQGILTSNKLAITSPYFKLDGKVQIDLDGQTINGSIKPMLLNIPEGVLDDKYQKLLNVPIPVKLKGSLTAPSISIDVKELILQTQKDKIDKKKDELKGKLMDKLMGKKKEPNSEKEGQSEPQQMTEKEQKKAKKDRLKEDLLKGLLGGKKDDDSDG